MAGTLQAKHHRPTAPRPVRSELRACASMYVGRGSRWRMRKRPVRPYAIGDSQNRKRYSHAAASYDEVSTTPRTPHDHDFALHRIASHRIASHRISVASLSQSFYCAAAAPTSALAVPLFAAELSPDDDAEADASVEGTDEAQLVSVSNKHHTTPYCDSACKQCILPLQLQAMN